MASRRKSSPRRKGARKPVRRQAARKGSVRKKSARRPGAARRKAPARKKAPGKKKASRAGAAAPARARASERRRGSPLADLARKIVHATQNLHALSIRDLYAPNATSREAMGDAVSGYEGLEAKLAQWNTMQDSSRTRWTPRHVLTGEKTICIEWDAKVHLRDGRVVDFSEVAVHDVEGGRIVAERYFYNPMQLGPPQA
jgi:ketosteroid isomerase-like protein